jgi:hypothetical protein
LRGRVHRWFYCAAEKSTTHRLIVSDFADALPRKFLYITPFDCVARTRGDWALPGATACFTPV